MAKAPIALAINLGPGVVVSAETVCFDGTQIVERTTYTITADGERGRVTMLAALAQAIRLCTFDEAVALVEMIRG